MKSWFTRISYKMLVAMMIAVTLSFFVVTSCSHANKFSDLVDEDGIYYNGTQEAVAVAQGSIFSQIVKALSTIATYILGLIGLGIRGTFIGWIQIAEMVLTAILDIDNNFEKINENAMDTYSEKIVNVESILFNKVPILNANIFDGAEPEYDDSNDSNKTEEEIEKDREKVTKSVTIVQIIKNAVAKWYYVLRLLAIAFMLLLGIFIGIKMAFSTIVSEKVIYKQMLIDWVVGLILVFSIHYVMILIFNVNDSIVKSLQLLLREDNTIELEEYQYGIEPGETYEELEVTLYESARTRAYSLSLTDGFTGLVTYGVLVYYAWRFSIMYIIRVFNLMILTLVAPIISASYAVNKVLTGKAKVFSNWLPDYVNNVIIQVFHVIIYVSFCSIALKLSMQSILGVILAFVWLHFMLEFGNILRTIFKAIGGKESLAGNMDKIGFEEIKRGVQSVKTAIVGGRLGKMAMQTTYRIATKPVRAAAEVAFGNYMVEKANRQEEEKRKKIEEKEELEEQRRKLEEEIATLRKQEELEEEHRRLSEEQNMAYLQKDKEGEEYATEELEKIEAQMSKRGELESIKEEIEYRNELQKIENLQEEFIEGTLKGGFLNLFDPKQYVVKGKDGKYHRMETKRKGGVKGAFWRQKKDSIGMRFSQNRKLKNLLNLSDEEMKVLKRQYNLSKSTILGFFSAVIGFPALVINPTLGIALLGQATYAGLNVATRIRQIRNRPSYKKDKKYNFVSFNKGAKYTIQLEAARQIREIEQTRTEEIEEQHKDFISKLVRNRIKPISDPIVTEELAELGYTKFTKQFKKALKQMNELETSMNVADFKKKFRAEEQQQRSQVEKMSEKQLMWNEYANNDDVVVLGEAVYGINLDNHAWQQENKFVQRAERKLDEKSEISRTEKLKAIQFSMRHNQKELVQNQIEKYYARRGIIDISNVKMSTEDVIKIKENTLGILEEKGIIKKGEIKLEDNFMSTEILQQTFTDLQNDKEQTNQSLEQRVATSAVLEYIQQTGITDKSELSQKTDEIYDLVKDKIMSEDSKKTADVIRQISGQDKKKEEVNLSDYMKQVVNKDIKKLKKVNKIKDKRKLVEHETNRRMNEVKNMLEDALYEDTTENIDSQNVLDMLFALSKIGENNRVAVEVNRKEKGKMKKAQMEKLEFYQDGSRRMNENPDGSRRFDEDRDGSRRFDENRDGSQKVIEELFGKSKQNALEKRLFGPEQNIIDLINRV